MFNPVNSPSVSLWAGLVGAGVHFPLWHAFRWTSLGDGVCPNAINPLAPLGDSDLQASITSDPPGVDRSVLGEGLYWLTDLEAVLAGGQAGEGGLAAPGHRANQGPAGRHVPRCICITAAVNRLSA